MQAVDILLIKGKLYVFEQDVTQEECKTYQFRDGKLDFADDSFYEKACQHFHVTRDEIKSKILEEFDENAYWKAYYNTDSKHRPSGVRVGLFETFSSVKQMLKHILN